MLPSRHLGHVLCEYGSVTKLRHVSSNTSPSPSRLFNVPRRLHSPRGWRTSWTAPPACEPRSARPTRSGRRRSWIWQWVFLWCTCQRLWNDPHGITAHDASTPSLHSPVRLQASSTAGLCQSGIAGHVACLACAYNAHRSRSTSSRQLKFDRSGFASVSLRTRLVDLYMREHITLLWVIEGEKFLRVHGGVVYFYHEDILAAVCMINCMWVSSTCR